jgi:hypothetical protein
MNEKEENEIETEDVFNGETLGIWKDEDFVWVQLFNTTIMFPVEEYDLFKKDIVRLADL